MESRVLLSFYIGTFSRERSPSSPGIAREIGGNSTAVEVQRC